MTSVVDPSGRTTRFEYDIYGRPSARIMSDGRRYELRYRADDLLSQTLRPDGITEAYAYDAAKRLTSKSAGGASVSYAYNARHQLTSASNEQGTVTLAYDSVGRLISETAGGHTVSSAYNADGERIEMRSVAATVGLTRDARGLPTGITAPEGMYSLGYDLIGRRSQLSFPNGTTTTYGYDAADQLQQIQSSGAFNETLAYIHDIRGLITGVASSQPAWSYEYDANGRLTTASNATGAFAYAYDAAGNRLGNDRTYDSANRLTGDADYAYTYDANGNLIEKRHRTSGARSVYSWNARNQLLSVQRFADEVSTQPVETRAFTYDALNRRASRTVNGVVERYAYDRLDRIMTLDANGNVIERVTFGPRLDEPLGISGATGERYLHANHLGSVVAVTGSGGLLGRYEYEPYGRSIGSVPTAANAFRYTAREYEAEDLYYYRARYYDPGIGRFLSEDPIGLNGGTNMYLYARANPLRWIDPFGLDASCVVNNDAAIEANTLRDQATDDLLESRDIGDPIGEQSASDRIDYFENEYRCRLCQGEPNTTPAPVRIPPTPPPPPPQVDPPPDINFEE